MNSEISMTAVFVIFPQLKKARYDGKKLSWQHWILLPDDTFSITRWRTLACRQTADFGEEKRNLVKL